MVMVILDYIGKNEGFESLAILVVRSETYIKSHHRGLAHGS